MQCNERKNMLQATCRKHKTRDKQRTNLERRQFQTEASGGFEKRSIGCNKYEGISNKFHSIDNKKDNHLLML